jgi:hypothetical protein
MLLGLSARLMLIEEGVNARSHVSPVGYGVASVSLLVSLVGVVEDALHHFFAACCGDLAGRNRFLPELNGRLPHLSFSAIRQFVGLVVA